MMQRKVSVTLRLTLLFALVSTAALLMLGIFVGRSVKQHFVELDGELLESKAHLVARFLQRVVSATDLDQLPQLLGNALVEHRELAVMVVGANSKTLFRTPNATFPETLLKHGAANLVPHSWNAQGRSWRGISTLQPTGAAQTPPLLVAVAVDMSHHEFFIESFRQSLWLFVAFSALLSGLLGWVAVRRGLLPLRRIREEAASVTASHLDHRIDMANVPGEFADLAESLNAMLARLEDSFKRLKDFSADLAHELRTPINNLMTETQVTLGKQRTPDEYREILASNAEEYEHLTRMISDMLFIAQADHGLLMLRCEPLRLSDQIHALFDFFEALAEEKGVRLRLAGDGVLSGDRLMLQRALANLISNAIRHSPADREVRLSIENIADHVRLTIANDIEETVSPEQLSRVFERFYRTDPPRHREGDGAGLGLAITRSIVQAHGGEISAHAEGESIRFELNLPVRQCPNLDKIED